MVEGEAGMGRAGERRLRVDALGGCCGGFSKYSVLVP